MLALIKKLFFILSCFLIVPDMHALEPRQKTALLSATSSLLKSLGIWYEENKQTHNLYTITGEALHCNFIGSLYTQEREYNPLAAGHLKNGSFTFSCQAITVSIYNILNLMQKPDLHLPFLLFLLFYEIINVLDLPFDISIYMLSTIVAVDLIINKRYKNLSTTQKELSEALVKNNGSNKALRALASLVQGCTGIFLAYQDETTSLSNRLATRFIHNFMQSIQSFIESNSSGSKKLILTLTNFVSLLNYLYIAYNSNNIGDPNVNNTGNSGANNNEPFNFNMHNNDCHFENAAHLGCMDEECPVCLQRFGDLPGVSVIDHCNHKLCTSCLQGMRNATNQNHFIFLKCPLCRHRFRVPNQIPH